MTLNNMTIKNKIRLVSTIPVIILLIVSIFVIYLAYDKKTKLEELNTLLMFSQKISLLVHEIQKERGASAGYLGSGGKDFKDILAKQRELTNEKAQDFISFTKSLDATQFPDSGKEYISTALSELDKIKTIRDSVDNLSIETKKAIGYYTNINKLLLNFVATLASIGVDEHIINDITAYYSFLMSKERAGIERAVGSNTFAQKSFGKGMFIKFVNLVDEQNIFLDNFYIYGFIYKDYVKEKLDDPIIAEVQKMRDILFSSEGNPAAKFDVDAKYWFQTITKKINILKQIDDYLINNIKDEANVLIDKSANLVNMLSIILAIVVFGTISLVLFFNKNIMDSINKMYVGIEQFMAYLNRDINELNYIDIHDNGELGKLARLVNANIDRINGDLEKDLLCVGEAIITLDKVEKGIYSCRVMSEAANPQVITFAKTINKMLDNQQEVIGSILKTLKEYADYNYLNSIHVNNNITGESKEMVDCINILGDAITTMLRNNKKSGEILLKGSNKLIKNVGKLNNASNDAASRLEETAAAIEQITGNIASSTENVAKMAQYAEKLTKAANDGERLAKETVNSMDDINSQVTAINEAISVIDQIAFQTNILSLNAAVEAATAGEAGKGFAVVAQEVRNLASRSAEAAKSIKDIVENATIKANNGKGIASKMIEGYNQLNENISNTISLIKDVDHSAKEQRDGIQQISDAVNSLDKQTQINANIASETNDIAQGTMELANNVVNATKDKKFKEV
ncbi:chemotaxis protein [Halarcobacter ebronensis]|uniref:Chemotaxis protein n=1 Tax=Halarcobacter ebronensis TaxID=1462615 RepID=A0A4Q0YEU0_9BACT|nr:methyl-accepting chemotaxis protein [Halarcobacter ebronensis]RXJ68154.1 chemotaxis protein [Halarcobacter ebronensis]